MEFKIEEVLSVSCAAHRINKGFIKKDQVRFDKKHEKSICNSDLLYNYFYTDKKFDILEQDEIMAKEVKEYLSGLSFKALERQLTEFESNVLKLVSSTTVAKEKLGIAASLPKVYFNKLEQDEWSDRETQLSRTSQPVGELHTRSQFDAVVEFIRYIPKTMSYLVTCSVEDKHILKFFTEKKLHKGPIQVEGYVKSQSKGRYHPGQETIINRINIKDVNLEKCVCGKLQDECPDSYSHMTSGY
jgi:hypothetical protein